MGLRFRANLVLTVLGLSLISIIFFSTSTLEAKFSKRSAFENFSRSYHLESNSSRQFDLTLRAESEAYRKALCAADALLADIRSSEDRWGTSLTFDDLKSQWEEQNYDDYFVQLDGSTATSDTSSTALKALGIDENSLVGSVWTQYDDYDTIHGMQKGVSFVLHFIRIGIPGYR